MDSIITGVNELKTTDEEYPHMMKLPNELLVHIFDSLQPKDLLQLTLTSRKLYEITTSTKKLYAKWFLTINFKNLEISALNQVQTSKALIRSDRQFQNLILKDITSIEDIEYISLVIDNFKASVKSIELYNCGISVHDFSLIFNELFNLEEIKFMSCAFIQKYDPIPKITIPPKFSKLKKLTINNTIIETEPFFLVNERKIDLNQLFSNALELNYAELDKTRVGINFLCNKNKLKTLKLEETEFFSDEDLSNITFSLKCFDLVDELKNDSIVKFLKSQSQLQELSLQNCIDEKLVNTVIGMNLKNLDLFLTAPNRLINSSFQGRNSSVQHLKLICEEDFSIELMDKLAKCFVGVQKLDLDIDIPENYEPRSQRKKITFTSGDRVFQSVALTIQGHYGNHLKIFQIKNLHKVSLLEVDSMRLEVWSQFVMNHPDVRCFELVSTPLNNEVFSQVIINWKHLEKITLDYDESDYDEIDLKYIVHFPKLKELNLIGILIQKKIESQEKVINELQKYFNEVVIRTNDTLGSQGKKVCNYYVTILEFI